MTTIVRRNGQNTPNAWDLLSGSARDQYNLATLINGSQLQSTVPADVFESEVDIKVILSLPGLNVETLSIEALDGVLTVSGEQKRHFGVDNSEYKRTYAGIAYFGRAAYKFSLPKLANPEAITASYADGILQITVPKQEAPKPVKVSVKVSANPSIETVTSHDVNDNQDVA